MPRCVVVAGGTIGCYGRARSYLRSDDYFVFCDCGLRHEDGLGVKASLIVGDFDSHEVPKDRKECSVICLPRMKDDTDTMYAIRTCVEKGFDDFLLLGMLGGRADHSLANIYALVYLFKKGMKALLVTDTQEMWIVGSEKSFIEPSKYFSLISISGVAKGVNIENALYPLEDATIESSWQYAVSNEVLPGRRAEVSVAEGCVLVIRTLDELVI